MCYLTGIRGGLDYARYLPRLSWKGPKKIREYVLESLERIIEEEKPDIIFLMEIQDYPELRSVAKAYPLARIDKKYAGTGFVGNLPWLKYNANGLFARQNYTHRAQMLSAGIKRLLHSVDIGDDIRFLLGHFALSSRARARQFAEVAHMHPDKRIIVAGDFNVFGGFDELQPLMHARDLKSVTSEGHTTYPTTRPRYALDLVLVPKEYTASFRVRRDICASDHHPVVCTVSLPQ